MKFRYIPGTSMNDHWYVAMDLHHPYQAHHDTPIQSPFQEPKLEVPTI